MRYVLSILVLSIAGCGSTSWFGLRRSAPSVCDGDVCAESSLNETGTVRLSPAPVTDYPMIEESLVPLEIPDFESGSTIETVPAPVPDPAT